MASQASLVVESQPSVAPSDNKVDDNQTDTDIADALSSRSVLCAIDPQHSDAALTSQLHAFFDESTASAALLPQHALVAECDLSLRTSMSPHEEPH